MKKLFLISTAVFFLAVAHGQTAQDTIKTEKKVREYYLGFTDIAPLNVSIRYKRQLSKKTFFEIGLIKLSASIYNSIPDNTTSYITHSFNYGAGFNTGLEFRRALTDKFTFFHGLNLGYTFNQSIAETENPALPVNQRKTLLQQHGGWLSYTFGLLYKLNNHFLFSAEINPGLSINYITFDNGQNPHLNYTSTSADFNLDNRNGFLSLVYRL
jgi:hypothetical protein